MMDKKWYESKTIWFNVLAIVVLVVKTIWPEFADFDIDPGIASGIVVLVNLALRFVTELPIKL